MAVNRKVIKAGNSLALTIPAKIIKDFDIKEGDMAQVKIKRAKSAIVYSFTGHPRQLVLIGK